MKNAYNQINKHLAPLGGLGNSLETITTKLFQKNLIKTDDLCGRVPFGTGVYKRGIQWIGEIPKEILNNK